MKTAVVGVSMADVEREDVEWLWDRRIPRGKITNIEGDPDEGKSALVLDLAARASTGRRMPFDPRPRRPAAGVVLMVAEDDLEDTVRPRLEAARADLALVRAVTPNDIAPIPKGIPAIRRALQSVDAQWLYIDTLPSFVSDRVRMRDGHSVRRLVLAPLAEVAKDMGIGVVVLRHLNKQRRISHAKYRGLDSIAFVAAARSALLAAPDPQNSDRKILAPIKHNLCAAPPALAYALVARGGTVRVKWLEETEYTADELLAQGLQNEKPSAGEYAIGFLRGVLADGPRAARMSRKKAREARIADRTLDRAKAALGVVSEMMTSDPDDVHWVWRMPGRPAVRKAAG